MFLDICFCVLLDIASLNNDEESYELLNTLETFMNAQNEDSDLLSVSSSEIQETVIEDATEAFLSAATEGNVELLTRLYESETKVEKECHKKCHIRQFNMNVSYNQFI